MDGEGKVVFLRKVANDQAVIEWLIARAAKAATEVRWAVDPTSNAAALLLAVLVTTGQWVAYMPGPGGQPHDRRVPQRGQVRRQGRPGDRRGHPYSFGSHRTVHIGGFGGAASPSPSELPPSAESVAMQRGRFLCPNVRCRRTRAAAPRAALPPFRCSSPRDMPNTARSPHRYSSVWHRRAEWVSLPPAPDVHGRRQLRSSPSGHD
ncbi:hypothetical protein E1288_45100 [Saccharopolyspora elongata]|uniref:Transposase IS110-like N-terminal domain-containing protein n=1 Tax=Saccharopolyspora elongata TaxID=2530387 RepID=A0A4R4XRG4_9PSEU|nr:hypothetical protein E1288_45100 [Saccharopolyspora elongata]